MKKEKTFENYPFWIVVISNLIQFLIYAIGIYVLQKIGLIWMLLYVFYIIFLEIRLMKISCVNCYYWGKVCFFGRGKICSLFFKKGEAKKFTSKKIGFCDLLPDLATFLIPMFAGIVLLVINFDLLLLLAVIALFFLGTVATGLLRNFLACKHCKQRILGCPAEKFFNKSKS